MNIESLPSGKTIEHLRIPDPSGNQDLELPVLVGKSSSPGPTLAVLGGVHGDEYEGVIASQDAFDELDVQHMEGTLIIVPVTNLPAYLATSRITPIDGKNLARVFPGDPNGTITERIAHHIGCEVIARADFLLDLHSSGTNLTSPTLVGYHSASGKVGELAAIAARSFGAPVIWEHRTVAPGRTISMAAALGIPALYTEAPGGMRVRANDLAIYREGIFNVMSVLGMLDRPVGPSSVEIHLGGDGDTDAMTSIGFEGLFRPSVELLEKVEKHQPIGTVRGLDGRHLETVTSPKTGRVAFLRAVPTVKPGDAAVLVADDLS